MTIYVLFVWYMNASRSGVKFEYEFKDKVQCEATLKNFNERNFTGFCQEIRR